MIFYILKKARSENKEMIKKSTNTREIFELILYILTVMTKALRNKEGNNKEEFRFTDLETVTSAKEGGKEPVSPYCPKNCIMIIRSPESKSFGLLRNSRGIYMVIIPQKSTRLLTSSEYTRKSPREESISIPINLKLLQR